MTEAAATALSFKFIGVSFVCRVGVASECRES
jgi:hypothetical protein